MKTIKIDKNSKAIKFLTARDYSDPLFGVLEWKPKPYKEGSWTKPLPTDTCSLRKALIAHMFKCICCLGLIILVVSFTLMCLLSALIVIPYEIYAGIFMQGKGTFVGAAGFIVWFLVGISCIAWLCYTIKESFKSLVKSDKKKKHNEKHVDSVFSVLYSSLKNKMCSKIEYVDNKEGETK